MAEHHRDVAEHKHGEMEISEQEKTFAGFIKFSIWTTVIIIVVLIFLALVGA